MERKPLHLETPLLESVILGKFLSGKVWLKMEALQPSGSFKTRGIGYACQEYVAQGAKKLFSSSGGNAGLAVAFAGRKLQVPTTVVVPESTGPRAIELIRGEGAEVIIQGKIWNEAHKYALKLAEKEEGAYLHPFDDPLLWKGHASMIDEIFQAGVKPDAVVLSVGGGGLLCGVLEGLHRNGGEKIPVIAMETQGADSFSQAMKAEKLVMLDSIQSIATSLGAKQVAQTALNWTQKHEVISQVVSDQVAVESCLQFIEDHRVVVEPACGASLSAIYQSLDVLQDKENIVVIVCGGVSANFANLQEWNQLFKQCSKI